MLHSNRSSHATGKNKHKNKNMHNTAPTCLDESRVLKKSLAKGVTADEEDDLDETTSCDAESFLETYEEMMRHQKEEMSATLRHLEPLLEVLDSKRQTNYSSSSSPSPSRQGFAKEFSYSELKQALNELEQDPSLKHVASDLQWNMVLQLLTENNFATKEQISWAEIVMCYRVCILGVQTLEQISKPSSIRSRVRQRSLELLSTFRDPSTSTEEVSRVQSASSSRDSSRSQRSFQTIDAIFVGGALLMLVLILQAFNAYSMSPLTSSTPGQGFDMLGRMPIVPGPKVPPFEVYTIIAGPKVPPFVSESMNMPTLPPVGVLQTRAAVEQELLKDSKEAPGTWAAKPSMDVPRQASSLKFQRRKSETTKTRSEGSVLSSSNRSDQVANASILAATLLAGGVAAAGVIGPVAATIGSSLAGTSLSPLLSVGATVVVSTLLAHGIRDWVVALFGSLRPYSKAVPLAFAKAKELVKSLVEEDKCFSSRGGGGTLAFGEGCAPDVVYEDCFMPQPFVGKRILGSDRPHDRQSGATKTARRRPNRSYQRWKVCLCILRGHGPVEVKKACEVGTTFVELNDNGEIQYVREIPEPLYRKPGDLTLELLKAVTKGVEPKAKPQFKKRTPTTATEVAKYLFLGVQGGDVNESMRLFDESIIYRDFNYEEPLSGKAEVRKFIDGCSFPGIEFRPDRFDDGIDSTCFKWDVCLDGQEDTIKGMSFYELDHDSRMVRYVRDVPAAAIKPAPLGKSARYFRPGLGVFKGVPIGSRPGGK